jgi:plasmid replication initiation protein
MRRLMLAAAFAAGMAYGQSATADSLKRVAALWMDKSAVAATCLTALDTYSQNPSNGSAALKSLIRNEGDPVLIGKFRHAASKPGFWESVVTTGTKAADLAGNSILGGKTNDGAVIDAAKDRIKALYGRTGVDKLAEIGKKADSGDSLRAISLLLSATDDNAADWVDEMQVYRACYARAPERLFGFVKEYLK